MAVITLLLLASATLVLGQRPFFAGSKPIGYPLITTTEGLGDRFGEIDGTTQRLPIEANGDRDLIDRLSKLPIDNQPFWFINWQALEAHRQKPQTYPQKPNDFIDPIQSGGSSSGVTNSNSGSSNINSSSGNISSDSVKTNPTSSTSNIDSANVNATAIGTASGFVSSNRFGSEEYPRNPENKLENAFTNSNSAIGQSVSGGATLNNEKKSPSKDTKTYQWNSYHK